MATETQTDGAITKDAELKAINAIIKAMAGLDKQAQTRVMSYVGARYPELMPQSGRLKQEGGAG